MAQTTDHLIVGGGVIGLSVARALLRRKAGRVVVLEKENSLGVHASGRNSGVVHAGIYYKPGTLKARLCVEGARSLSAYATERGIRIERVGKVVVASNEQEAVEAEKLFRQALSNGVRAELVSEDALRRIEPAARTVRHALFSPDTAIIDSKAVLFSLRKEIEVMGGQVVVGAEAAVFEPEKARVSTRRESWSYGALVNAAGLYADKVAHRFGVGREYRILPVKGMYRQLTGDAALNIRRLIYPVPDPAMPFLGVHLTPMLDGRMLAGPTAFPVLGRENYSGLGGMRFGDGVLILKDLARMFWKNTNHLRNLARQESKRMTKNGFYDELRKLAPSLTYSQLGPYVKCGIRAQLIETATGRFEMDFVLRKAANSLHILNAVSPAFTCSLSFAETVADELLLDRKGTAL